MAQLSIAGDTSGSITLAAPSVSGTTTLTLPTTTGTIALTSQIISSGSQTWHDVTSSRALTTTYTNYYSYPIMVVITGQETGNQNTGYLILTCDSVTIGSCGVYGSGNRGGLSMIVPAGKTYSATGSGSVSLQQWSELY